MKGLSSTGLPRLVLFPLHTLLTFPDDNLNILQEGHEGKAQEEPEGAADISHERLEGLEVLLRLQQHVGSAQPHNQLPARVVRAIIVWSRFKPVLGVGTGGAAAGDRDDFLEL